MLVNPDEQLETQFPFCKTPFKHLQTPLTDEDPAGHAVVHLPFKRLKSFKQDVHDS